MSKKKIFMGICSTGDRIDIHTYLFRDLQQMYGDKIEMVFPDTCVHRTFHDFARNEMVDEFLATDCDAIWFLDSDVCPPKFVFDLITNHWDKWQVAGAPYPLWMPAPGTSEPSILFTSYDGLVEDEAGNKKGIMMTEVPESGTKFVDAVATGCMFIKREVFEQVQKPYFEFKFDTDTRKIKEGEDLGFCLKLNEKGIRCFIDYGMVCKHYKRVCLLDINNYAISMANHKVLDYDKSIRQQVNTAIQLAQKDAYERGFKQGIREGQRLPQQTASGLILPSR